MEYVHTRTEHYCWYLVPVAMEGPAGCTRSLFQRVKKKKVMGFIPFQVLLMNLLLLEPLGACLGGKSSSICDHLIEA